ncbi:MAG: hypothetical protein JKY37_22800 [Nannocystaceae bacterium]|nr:hypothetical protein [Nannocystaceae bacterium]
MSWSIALLIAGVATNVKAPEPPAVVPTVLVQPLAIVGEVAPAWQTEFRTRLHDGLRRGAARLVLPASDACESGEGADDSCWTSLATQRDAAFIIAARVSRSDRDYFIRLEVVSAASGQIVASTEQPCELCGLAEVGRLLEDIAGTIAARVDALASARTVVLFTSAPAGALVKLDGEVLGTMPLSHEVNAGPHQAEAALADHVTQTRSFRAEPGVDQTLRFELAPRPTTDRTVLPAIGWASLGVGVAAVGAGGFLLAIHNKPVSSNCSGENVNAAGVCKFQRDTRAGGISLVAGGAVAVIAGVAIAIVARKHHRGRVAARRSGLTVRF